MKRFTVDDIDETTGLPGLYADREMDLEYSPPAWMKAGLQETATGYGKRLNSGYMIHFEGRKRRVYVTCYGNSGTSWFTYLGQRIIVR